MSKHVIIVTGTPCVGKTSAARLLTAKLDGYHLNLTALALEENLTLGEDKERDTTIIDEERMRQKIRRTIENCDKDNIIIDGHYAVTVVPEEFTADVFVLRRDPVELRKFMEQRGFAQRKLWENLASEILDVCLCDALNSYAKEKVCEIDVSGKTVEETVCEIIDFLNGRTKCRVGVVDWLGKLEKEGLLQEYLKT